MISKGEVGVTSPTWGRFSLVSDEGSAIGGTDTAPAPLCYLIAGIGFCFLSHIAMYSRAVNMNIKKAVVEVRMKFSVVNNPELIKEKGLEGGSEGLELHFDVESDEPQQDICKMYDECVKSCLAIQSIVNSVPLESHLHLNGTRVT